MPFATALPRLLLQPICNFAMFASMRPSRTLDSDRNKPRSTRTPNFVAGITTTNVVIAATEF